MSRPIPTNLLPDTAAVGDDGWLSVGGCSLGDLASEFDTPLFVYDEQHLQARCREAVAAFPDGAAYAAKAFLCRAMARLALDEGMRLDDATSGELHVAIAAGASGDQLVL
ncbi:MAG: diaminopimelate decarboxylase, partial [Acidimicrobiaceae bacterium]